MKTTLSFVVSAAFAAALSAQQEEGHGGAKPGEMPNPKHPQHRVLQTLVGNWQTTMRNEAMPGVPGMEEAGEAKGTERGESLSNGLWVKWTVDSQMNGKPFQGLWLVGYDPHEKQYVSVWVSSDESCPGVTTMTGDYDVAKKTWTWIGKSPEGEMRSVMVVDGEDSMKETCYMTGPDGEEKKCMEITRRRAPESARPADASSSTGARLPQEIASMQKDIGDWQATVRFRGEGRPQTEGEATEKVTPAAGGRWLWSDFNGEFMGQPFEGHCLTGYDPAEKKVVSIWIDSMSPTWCRTSGTPAEDGKLQLSGERKDPSGAKMTVQQTYERTNGDTRKLHMESKCAQGDSVMDITYRRKKS